MSWDDVKEYAAWLAQKTGRTYRLLTEAEWEYAARAGTTTPFSTGSNITSDQANFDGKATYPGGIVKERNLRRTDDVGSFPPNAFGLHDMHGNVWEWVEDCYEESYTGAPTDGAARYSVDCILRVVRGGSWAHRIPALLRSATRYRFYPVDRQNTLGFRVARSL